MLKYFAKSFSKKKRTQKTFAGSHVGTLAAFVMDNLYMDLPLDRQTYLYGTWRFPYNSTMIVNPTINHPQVQQRWVVNGCKWMVYHGACPRTRW